MTIQDRGQRFRELLDDKTAKRLKTVQRLRKRYIETPRDAQIRTKFDGVLKNLALKAGNGVQDELGGLVVVAESGAGKTTSIRWMLSNHPALPDFGQPGCPVVSVMAPGPCTLKQLGRVILKNLGYPLVADRKEHETWEIVRRKLAELGVVLLHIDEIQNITDSATTAEAARLRDTLKSLLNDPDNPIGLLLSGLPSVRSFLEEDYQLVRRMNFLALEPLPKGRAGAIANVAADYARAAGLKAEIGGDLVQRLVHSVQGAMGESIKRVCDAIELALESGDETLTGKHFAGQHARRTGCGPRANPFLVQDWWDIQPGRVLTQNPQEHLAEEAAAEILAQAKIKKDANKAKRRGRPGKVTK